jgi:hypothetical protein
VQGGGKRAHLQIIERCPAVQFAPCAELGQGQQIVPIRSHGMSTHAPLVREVRYKSIDPLALARIHQRISA